MPYPAIDVTPHVQAFARVTGRPITMGVMHNTVSDNVALTRVHAGWHWQVGRNGWRYRTVREQYPAYGVEDAGRWPDYPYIRRGPGGFSDVNWCAVQIELTSLMGSAPIGYVPYTADQYASLRELLGEIHRRHGRFPWVAHGALQKNRTDPVGFDWARAGFQYQAFTGWWYMGNLPDPDPIPLPPMGEPVKREDAEILGANLWPDMYLTWNPAHALPRAWLNAVEAGHYAHVGAPLSAEIALSGGRAMQRFERNVAVWEGGDTVNWASPLPK